MHRVYDIHQMNASQQHTFVADIHEDQLDTIEGNFKFLAPAANACRNLLAAARAVLGGEQQNGDEQASRVQNIGVGSTYHSTVNQDSLWVRNFPGYYEDTQPEHSRMADGEHGEAAARHLAGQITG